MAESISEEDLRKLITACLPGPETEPGMEVLGFSLTATKRETEQGRDSPVLDVYFPHALYARWFRQDGRSSTLEYAAHLALGSHLTVRYHDAPREIPEAENTAEDQSGTAPDALSPLPSDMSPPDREEYGFDNFFSGQKNELAVSIIRSMLEDLKCGSMPYNPLLLRGLPGTGKTHLLKAAAAALRHIPALAEQGRIYTLSAPDFAGLFRQSPARQEIVRGMLRGCSALCLDDTHLLVRSPQAQEELTSLIDILTATNRPVLCACTCLSPRQRAELAGADAADIPSEEQLAPSLLSRLRKGMVLELAEADLDVRLSYARHLLKELHLNTDRETPLFLARRSRQIRHLHGVILRMHAFSVIPATCRMSRIWKDSSALRVHATA